MHRPHSDSLAAAGRTSPPAAHGPLPPAFPRLLLFSVDLNLLGAGAMSLLPPLLSGSVAASLVTTAANHCWPRLLTPDSGAWGGVQGTTADYMGPAILAFDGCLGFQDERRLFEQICGHERG